MQEERKKQESPTVKASLEVSPLQSVKRWRRRGGGGGEGVGALFLLSSAGWAVSGLRQSSQ